MSLTPNEEIESPQRNNINPLQGDLDKQEIDPEDVKIELDEKSV